MTNSSTVQTPTSPVNEPVGKVRRKPRFAVALALGAAVLVASTATIYVATRDAPIVDSGPARVAVATVDGLGEVLVDGEGRTLYLFEPDEGGVVTCTGGCAAKWPPLQVAENLPPQIGAGVDQAQIDTVTDQDGKLVATFAGWPLYRYTSDELGKASGTGKDQNGGKWWALTPTGERINP